jgi:hypothetical protein
MGTIKLRLSRAREVYSGYNYWVGGQLLRCPVDYDVKKWEEISKHMIWHIDNWDELDRSRVDEWQPEALKCRSKP